MINNSLWSAQIESVCFDFVYVLLVRVARSMWQGVCVWKFRKIWKSFMTCCDHGEGSPSTDARGADNGHETSSNWHRRRRRRIYLKSVRPRRDHGTDYTEQRGYRQEAATAHRKKVSTTPYFGCLYSLCVFYNMWFLLLFLLSMGFWCSLQVRLGVQSKICQHASRHPFRFEISLIPV